MNRVYFIRHGATAGNLEKRYIGRTDEPLCGLGISHAERLRTHNIQANRIFTSPALRTRQTSAILFPQAEPEIVENLIETDFGIFEDKNAQELYNSAEYRAWVDSGCQEPIPQGESIAGFKDRCCKAFQAIMQSLPDGEAAAFVIHGGCIMAVLEEFAWPKRDFYHYHIENGSFVECEYQDSVLKLVNWAESVSR